MLRVYELFYLTVLCLVLCFVLLFLIWFCCCFIFSGLQKQPGGGLEGVLAGTLLDPLNGMTATVEKEGLAGESGSTFNAAWPATSGSMWQGGNGCEFGAGGKLSVKSNQVQTCLPFPAG
jgi:hypothetical protein